MTASEIRALFAVASRPEVVSLAGGMPNLAALPLDALAGEVAELVARDGQVALQYGSAQGRPGAARADLRGDGAGGDPGRPDDVVVTVGSQMALDLVTRIFCDPGDVVLAEGPSYVGALGSFAAYQARVVHVAMDAHGLVPRAAARRAARPLPAGVSRSSSTRSRTSTTRPASRWPSSGGARCSTSAAEYGVAVRRGQPVRAAGLHRAGLPGAAVDGPRRRSTSARSRRRSRPGLRVGWALVPPAVRDRLVLAAESATLCPPSFNQMLVSRYLAAHDWRGQVKTLHRGLPRPPRRDARARWRPTCPPVARGTSPTAASTCGSPCPRASTRRRCSRAPSRRGWPTRRAPGSTPTGLGSRQLRLSYCYPTPERITEGVRRLAGVLEAELDVLHTFGNPARPRRRSRAAGAVADTP